MAEFEKNVHAEGLPAGPDLPGSAAVAPISVVIPALDEEERIAGFLSACRSGGPREIIVVDGGSQDRTASLAEAGADVVIEQRGGLARQINRGAAAASSDILFFPYVDTHLPGDWTDQILAVLGDPRTVGGAFRLGFESPRLRFRVIAMGANLRTSMGLGPLGDQGIFVRREAFEQLGGYRDDALLEDLDFVRRLRRLGRVRVVGPAVKSSVRRWEQRGTVATAIRNWGFLASHFLGMGGERRRGSYQRYRTRR